MPDRDVIMVTGASSGIGAAIASRLARRGCRLALAQWGDAGEPPTHPEDAAAIVSRQLDVRDRAAVEKFVAATVESFGRIDALVTSAGIYREAPSESASWEDWDEVLATNLTGTWSCIRAVLPTMLAQGKGQILTISSELGLTGEAESAAYCASKGGVISLTKALAREYAPAGLRINSIAPGPVRTPLLEDSPRNTTDEAAASLPLGRFGHPEEIAAVVDSILGEAGTFFVGQVISPNGGAVI